jgi:hypothetical protein
MDSIFAMKDRSETSTAKGDLPVVPPEIPGVIRDVLPEDASIADQSFGVSLRSMTTGALQFCGKGLSMPEIGLAMKADNWESSLMLQGVRRSHVAVENIPDLAAFYESCKRNTQAEYDADKMCNYLESRVEAGTLTLSPEFIAFEIGWRRDELNHAIGFAMLEALLNKDASTMEAEYIHRRFDELRAQGGSFKALEEQGFLEDEFTASVTIAYDEIRTAMEYSHSARLNFPPLDRSEESVLTRWITGVARDESHHWSNICQVIRRNHAHRLSEVPDLVERMVRFETSAEYEYSGTFVFDHPNGASDSGSSQKAAHKVIQALKSRH